MSKKVGSLISHHPPQKKKVNQTVDFLFFIHCKSNGISSPKAYIISHRLYQSFAMMRYDSNELMIYNFCEIDDIQDSVLIWLNFIKQNYSDWVFYNTFKLKLSLIYDIIKLKLHKEMNYENIRFFANSIYFLRW